MSENDVVRLPEVIVFAGPNGSGKSTITRMAKIGGEYINADDIKRTILCTDLEAAIKAEELRERMIVDRKDFTFETVLSTNRNLLLLQRAKEKGYFIRGIYILTCNADINVARVNVREALGGHGVPEEKIRSRYDKALALIPEFVGICDILHIYDNTQEPFRIFKKRKDIYYRWSNQYWSNDNIKKLTGIAEFAN
jgi:predicted ABC-type ATPase